MTSICNDFIVPATQVWVFIATNNYIDDDWFKKTEILNIFEQNINNEDVDYMIVDKIYTDINNFNVFDTLAPQYQLVDVLKPAVFTKISIN